MTRIEKLYAKLVSSRTAMRFADFERILKALGFTLDRINGSHHIYKHPKCRAASASSRAAGRQSPIRSTSFLIWSRSSGLR